MTSRRRYRCRFCGHVLPAWLSVTKPADGAMLLHHLGQDHRGQVGPYLRRMETADIATIMLELFDLVEGEGTPPRHRSVTSDDFTDLTTGEVPRVQAKESPP